MSELATDDTLMRSVLQRIATGPELSKDISRDEACAAMASVLEGTADPVQAGVFLIALRMKRETDEELRGVLQAIRDVTARAQAEVDHVLDIVDPYDGFNRNLLISPFLPAVLASCAVATVSHGVPSIGPKYGVTHSQVLSAAGAEVDHDASQVAERLARAGIGWGYVDQGRFCPKLHALVALRHLIVKRPSLTTVEVLAGPVTGRLGTHFVTGYVHKPYPRIYALLARHAGFSSALLVRGIEGGVTPSLRQTAKVWRYHGDEAETDFDIEPDELGIVQTSRGVPLPEGIAGYRRKNEDAGEQIDTVAMAKAAAQTGLAALSGEPGPARDSLIYGGSLCLWHLNRADSVVAAAAKVRAVLDDGTALSHFERGR